MSDELLIRAADRLRADAMHDYHTTDTLMIRDLAARVRELEGELEQKAETVMAFDDVLVSAMQKRLRELEAEVANARGVAQACEQRAERAEAERDKAEHETGKAYIERDALRAVIQTAAYGTRESDPAMSKLLDAALAGGNP